MTGFVLSHGRRRADDHLRRALEHHLGGLRGLGIFYSRQGKQRVERGETPKHGGLAQAGFITGIITLVVSLLATSFWVLILVLYATDDEFRRDFEDDFEGEGEIRTMVIQYVAAFLT